jgi:hypothetical protein
LAPGSDGRRLAAVFECAVPLFVLAVLVVLLVLALILGIAYLVARRW